MFEDTAAELRRLEGPGDVEAVGNLYAQVDGEVPRCSGIIRVKRGWRRPDQLDEQMTLALEIVYCRNLQLGEQSVDDAWCVKCEQFRTQIGNRGDRSQLLLERLRCHTLERRYEGLNLGVEDSIKSHIDPIKPTEPRYYALLSDPLAVRDDALIRPAAADAFERRYLVRSSGDWTKGDRLQRNVGRIECGVEECRQTETVQ